MKMIISIMVLLPFTLFGQKAALYYFHGKDTALIGVKTAAGKILIPPVYGGYAAAPGDKVAGNEILLFDKTAVRVDSMSYNYSFKLFNRKGTFLYCPFWFDNGPDYYVEGLRRFVENGK